MKKLLLSIAFLAGVGFTSQAQTQKGNILLGGNVSWENNKSKASGSKASNSLEIVPSVGYFISDNFAIGTGVGYSYYNAGQASNTGQLDAFVVAPFGRYYGDITGGLKYFGQLSVPMSFASVKETNADGDAGAKTGKSTEIGVALSPGLAFFPSKKIGIEFAVNGLSYNNTTIKDGNGNKLNNASSESFSFGADFFSPKIGVQFYF